MAREILLNVKVNDQDLDTLQAELAATEQAFREVGVEARKTSAQVDDVASNGGAIAILDQLTGGLATRMRDAYEASKLFNGSLKAQRAALLATGIGAFVVVLGAVVAYWDEIVELITQSNARLQKQNELLEANLGILDQQIANLEKQIGLEEAQGGNAEELRKQRQVLLEQAQKENELRVEGLRLQLARLQSSQSELTIWEQIEGGFFRMFGGSEGLAQKSVEFAQKREAEVKALEQAIASAEGKAIDLNIALAGGSTTDSNTGASADPAQVRGDLSSVGGLEPADAVRVSSAELAQERLLEIGTATSDELYQQQVALAQAEFALEEKKKETKLNNMQVIGQALGGLSQLAGQNTVIGKGLAVAQATIDTFVGANKALAQGGLFGGIAAAGIIATGLANVRTILSTQVPLVPGVGGVSGVGGTASLPSAQQPSFNIVGDTGINQLNETIGRQNETPARAYVVYDDITTAGQLEKQAVDSSTV